MLAGARSFLAILAQLPAPRILIAHQYIMPRFGPLFRSNREGDLGHLSGHDDNVTKEWYPSSEENRNNTLIALLCVKPLAWLELPMSTKHERPLLTNRRSFLRVVGGVGLTSVVAPGYLMANLSNTASGILVEAAGFDLLHQVLHSS